MQDVAQIQSLKGDVVLDTGSPHYVKFVPEMPAEDFVSQARKIRNSEEYITDGINVNFAKISSDKVEMRTFERGVEDETLACGTGATAVALAAHQQGLIQGNEITLAVKGGELSVKFTEENGRYSSVWLTGPAEFVFLGNVHAS
jgi:diaminopimelate epimerase